MLNTFHLVSPRNQASMIQNDSRT